MKKIRVKPNAKAIGVFVEPIKVNKPILASEINLDLIPKEQKFSDEEYTERCKRMSKRATQLLEEAQREHTAEFMKPIEVKPILASEINLDLIPKEQKFSDEEYTERCKRMSERAKQLLKEAQRERTAEFMKQYHLN